MPKFFAVTFGYKRFEQEEEEATEEESLVLCALRYLLFKIFTDSVGKFWKLFLATGLIAPISALFAFLREDGSPIMDAAISSIHEIRLKNLNS